MVLCVKWNQNGNWVLTASKDQIIKVGWLYPFLLCQINAATSGLFYLLKIIHIQLIIMWNHSECLL